MNALNPSLSLRKRRFRWWFFCVTALLVLTSASHPRARAQSCMSFVDTFYLNDNCTAAPHIQRVLSLDILQWAGGDYLVRNSGRFCFFSLLVLGWVSVRWRRRRRRD
jgi:hypothetical protein